MAMTTIAGALLTDDRPRLEFWKSTRSDRALDLTALEGGDADDVIGR